MVVIETHSVIRMHHKDHVIFALKPSIIGLSRLPGCPLHGGICPECFYIINLIILHLIIFLSQYLREYIRYNHLCLYKGCDILCLIRYRIK